MAAPRPKKKAPVKKTNPKTKDDNFSRFKESYKEGKVKILANPPPMPGPAKAATVVKIVSKAAKDLRSTDPKSLRNKALREANRAANQNKPKYKEKIGPNRPQGPEAPKYSEKIGPTRPAPSAASTASTTASTGSKVLKYGTAGLTAGLMIGGGIGYLTSKSGQGKSSTGSPFSKGKGSAAQPKAKGAIMPKASMAGGGVNKPGGQSSGNTSRVGGPGGARALENVKAKKSGSAKAASVAPANASSGTSQAAKTKRRSPTRYQRNETAMEQRKSSSGKPKKSIFSLFRKG